MLAGRLNVKTREFAMVDVPVPEPARDQVRIKVAAAGVCLSDVHLIDGTLGLGRENTVTLGHEVAGTIDALGAEVTGWQPGQRVILQAGERNPSGRMLTRGVDYDGGWAEYALATATTLVAIPDSLPFDQAAIIPDAVSTPWGAIVETANVRPGQAVGVWGAGGLGAHGVQLLRLVGAAPIVVVDPLPAARERALALGADVVLSPTDADFGQRMWAETDGAGLSAAFDFAGVTAVRDQAVGCLGAGGRLVLVGLSGQPFTVADSTAFSFLQRQILGHYGYQPGAVEQLVGLARRGRLDLSGSISDVLPLAQAADAVARLQSKEGNPIRLILRP
ncbi:zinc-binding dehydrogenase [Fodinicola feengrottensis]|uniref:Zinc-binding dehydrogenase n=1 Tax=Fodinicola feengrottensis TaxID=435914 RepID=A0ABN2G120_9ACTN